MEKKNTLKGVEEVQCRVCHGNRSTKLNNNNFFDHLKRTYFF